MDDPVDLSPLTELEAEETPSQEAMAGQETRARFSSETHTAKASTRTKLGTTSHHTTTGDPTKRVAIQWRLWAARMRGKNFFASSALVLSLLALLMCATQLLPGPYSLLGLRRTPPASGSPRCAVDVDQIAMPQCAQSGRARSFVMIFMGESGSSALMGGLMRHSQVYKKDPKAGPDMDEMELVQENKGWTAEQKAEKIRAYFDDGLAQRKIPGFKVRPGDTESVQQVAPDYQPRFIWNYRQNSVLQAIGMYHRKYSRVPFGGLQNSTFNQECTKSGHCKFNVPIPALVEQLKSMLGCDTQIMEAVSRMDSSCVLPIAYEEFDECPELAFAQIFKFLGLDYEYHPPEYVKMSSNKVCDMVTNWDEICQTFMPCRDFRWQINSQYACKCNNLNSSLLNQQNCPLTTPSFS